MSEAEASRPRVRPDAKPSRSWPVLLLGVVLTAAGAAALVVSARPGELRAHRVGANLPVNAGATDRLDVTAHNSPAVALNPRDPANLAIASRVDSPRFSCSLHVSSDGGARWTETPVPMPEGAEVGCFSPDVAFGADGRLYLSFVSFARLEGQGTVPDAIWITDSADGGRTLSSLRRAGGALAFQVRLLADAAQAGRLYLGWTQSSGTSSWGFANAGNPIVVSRSDDGGATWGSPTQVSAPDRLRVVAPTLAAGGGGDLYLAYLDVGDDRLDYHGGHEGRGGDPYPGTWSLVLARSRDGGATWQESVVERQLVPTQRFLVLFPPAPALAVDAGKGAVYVAFPDGRLGDADVWVWRSEDRGGTWAPPRRVPDTPRRDGRSQHLPAASVAPDGRVDVVYYDRRADRHNVMTEVSLQSSGDGGRTFSSRLRLSDRPFDSRIGFGRERDMPELGNRLGLVSTNRGALAVWADTRSGLELTAKQDLARALVAVSRPAGLQGPLRVVGAAAVVVGVVLVLLGRAPRRSTVRGVTVAHAPVGEAAVVVGAEDRG